MSTSVLDSRVAILWTCAQLHRSPDGVRANYVLEAFEVIPRSGRQQR